MFYEPFHLFGPIKVAPYGIMVALGLLAAIVLGGRENQRIKLMTPELFEKVALWTVLWGLIVSRMFYVFTDLDRFLAKPGSMIAIWEGGLVFYGGPIGSALYLVYHFVIRRHGPREGTTVATYKEGWARLLRFFDLGAPFLALAHGFGRLGCLCAGCCYGAPHDGLLSLHYPEGSPAYAGGMGRYPIPLIESGIEFMLFFWLMNLRLNKRFHGQVMLHYVMIYPAVRFVLEMFRGDAVRGYVMRLDTPGLNEALGLDPSIPVMLTTSQFISVLVVAAAIVLIFVGKKAAADGLPPDAVWWTDEQAGEEDEDEEDEDEDADADAEQDADAEDEEASAAPEPVPAKT
ncbi:MAG TPA: prolipoprotein diacylglyceryl transferase family protein [Enhygromyxa sp.]|nr:prolipoprotein diacylglyceryl transferase family protein [Enhygromyxa sp.]